LSIHCCFHWYWWKQGNKKCNGSRNARVIVGK